jgi:hypothetical protein
MVFEVIQAKGGVEIHLHGTAEGTDAVMERLNTCVADCRKCPVAETADFGTMEVSGDPRDMTVRIAAKGGSAIDAALIERCLASKMGDLD